MRRPASPASVLVIDMAPASIASSRAAGPGRDSGRSGGFSITIPRLRGNPKKPLVNQFRRDSSPCMIRVDFLDPESHRDLIDPGRDGSVAHRLARRVNALMFQMTG